MGQISWLVKIARFDAVCRDPETPQIMTRRTPNSAADWILEAIINDYAASLKPPDRTCFYERLAALIAQCCEDEEQFADIPDRKTTVKHWIQ